MTLDACICLQIYANIMQLWHRNKIIEASLSLSLVRCDMLHVVTIMKTNDMNWLFSLAAWSRTGAAPTWLWHFWFGALPRLQTSTVSWQILCHGIACELVD